MKFTLGRLLLITFVIALTSHVLFCVVPVDLYKGLVQTTVNLWLTGEVSMPKDCTFIWMLGAGVGVVADCVVAVAIGALVADIWDKTKYREPDDKT